MYLNDFEHRLAIIGMNSFRNHLIQNGKPTEDVDALLVKLLKAKSKRSFRSNSLSRRTSCATSIKHEWRETQCKN